MVNDTPIQVYLFIFPTIVLNRDVREILANLIGCLENWEIEMVNYLDTKFLFNKVYVIMNGMNSH